MPDLDHLMLGQVKGIGGAIVALDKLDKAQRFCKLIHAALRTVELDPGNVCGAHAG